MIICDWLLTPHRVALHRPTATAVVADLHLGYQEARRQSGDAVPLVDLEVLLAPLVLFLERHQAHSLIIAGDLFEKAFDVALWHQFETCLKKTNVQALGVIPGNHDRGFNAAPPDVPLLPQGHLVGDWHILHGDGPLPETPVVLGHFHPCIGHRGQRIPCYLAGARRLVLPAYSSDAAGVTVHPAGPWQGFRCLGIASERIIDLGVLRR